MATITKRTDNRTGKPSWQVKIRLRGYPARSKTFARLTDAKRWAAQTETDLRLRRAFPGIEAEKRTLGELIERYEETELPKIRTAENRKQQLRWWKEELGNYLLADIGSARIGKCRDKLAKGGRSPATLVRYLAALSHVFSIARKEYKWVSSNPVADVSKPTEPRGRVRFLSDDERERLLTACRESSNPLLYPAFVLSLATGMRQGESMSLSWSDVDLDSGRIVLHETKNGTRRVVPLTGHALEVLKEHEKGRDQDSELLFPGRDPHTPIDLRKPWNRALEEAGIEDYRWHDNRHSAASYLAMNGASLAEIAEVLGHKTLAMVKRYSHLSEAHTAGVVERMNKAIFDGARR